MVVFKLTTEDHSRLAGIHSFFRESITQKREFNIITNEQEIKAISDYFWGASLIECVPHASIFDTHDTQMHEMVYITDNVIDRPRPNLAFLDVYLDKSTIAKHYINARSDDIGLRNIAFIYSDTIALENYSNHTVDIIRSKGFNPKVYSGSFINAKWNLNHEI